MTRGWIGNSTCRAAGAGLAALVCLALASCGLSGGRDVADGGTTDRSVPVAVGSAEEVTGTVRSAGIVEEVTGAAEDGVRGSAGVRISTGATTLTAVSHAAAGRRSALTGLAGYLTAVRTVDAQLRRVTVLVNQDFSEAGVRIRPVTVAAITGVDVGLAARALPVGTDPRLTRAALLVYSELGSRRAAFNGALELADPLARTPRPTSDPMVRELLECLTNGIRANARFAADVDAMRSLAASLPAFTPGSRATRAGAELAVQVRYIDGQNNCCASCGGYLSTRPAPVTWRGERDEGFGRIDGRVDGIPFRVTWRPGTGWQVDINAG